MKTTEFFNQKPVLSFEIFPPKPTSPIDTIYKTLDGIKDLNPDFISITYGAAGSNNNNHTFRIASDIRNKYQIESIAHLSCMGMSKEDVFEELDSLKKLGVENILALRGDIPKDRSSYGDFKYAYELIDFIKNYGGFNIIAACYPEGHIECDSRIDGIRHLKQKVESGAEHLISQLFLDNECFYPFLERCRVAGINVPIEAGIMPVVNKKQIERMASLCGAAIPKKFITMMERYEDNPIALRDAGIAYAIDQIVDLIAQGVDGIHLYTMNNPYIARKIYEAINSLIER